MAVAGIKTKVAHILIQCKGKEKEKEKERKEESPKVRGKAEDVAEAKDTEEDTHGKEKEKASMTSKEKESMAAKEVGKENPHGKETEKASHGKAKEKENHGKEIGKENTGVSRHGATDRIAKTPMQHPQEIDQQVQEEGDLPQGSMIGPFVGILRKDIVQREIAAISGMQDPVELIKTVIVRQVRVVLFNT